MINIVTLSTIADSSSVKRQIEEIFFEASSRKEFDSEERRQSFYKRWCKDYQDYYSDEFFLLMEGNKLLGYLSGCSNSHESLTKLEVPGLSVFADLFNDFPAHLHINFHHDARGSGLGSILVNHYIEWLRSRHCKGLHLVTGRESKNRVFYERLGFNHHDEREFKGMQLFFMGKILEQNGRIPG